MAKSDPIMCVLEPVKLTWWTRIKVTVAAAKSVWCRLGDSRTRVAVGKLSTLTGRSPEKTVSNSVSVGMGLIPKNLDRHDWPSEDAQQAEVVSEGCDMVTVTTRCGYTFYDWLGGDKYRKLYWLLRSNLKKSLTPETFFAAAAVDRSFVHSCDRFPGDRYIPAGGGCVIEAGAYVGYKAIGIARQLGRKGRVLAIEVDSGNFELLSKNIAANELGDRVSAVNCAVWRNEDQIGLASKGKMQHTVAATDELKFGFAGTVEARS